MGFKELGREKQFSPFKRRKLNNFPDEDELGKM